MEQPLTRTELQAMNGEELLFAIDTGRAYRRAFSEDAYSLLRRTVEDLRDARRAMQASERAVGHALKAMWAGYTEIE